MATSLVWAAAPPAPTTRPAPAPPNARQRTGPTQLYFTFVINCHDFLRHDHSAKTLLRLIDLFERHELRAEFYLTAPLVEAYLKHQSQVIRRLKSGRMTVSYHYRPPHPVCFAGEAARSWKPLALAEKIKALRGLETCGWDAETGRPRRQGLGGYLLLKQTFGRAPVACGTGAISPEMRRAELAVLREHVSELRSVKLRPAGALAPTGAESEREPAGQAEDTENRPLAGRALHYLNQHYMDAELSVPHVARTLEVNDKYLSNVFARHVGTRMRAYIIELRVRRACELLLTTAWQIKRIAHESGFHDSAHFGRCFRRQVGVAAGEYRRVFSAAG